jgi:hypothetical protein
MEGQQNTSKGDESFKIGEKVGDKILVCGIMLKIKSLDAGVEHLPR